MAFAFDIDRRRGDDDAGGTAKPLQSRRVRRGCPQGDHELLLRWHVSHDIEAAGRLARRYRGLVEAIAAEFQRVDLEGEALVGEAQIGFMRAICSPDPEKIFDFRGYAILCIRVALLGYFLQES
jgi:DNA-directed RNA polymerase specialized sigma subunit